MTHHSHHNPLFFKIRHYFASSFWFLFGFIFTGLILLTGVIAYFKLTYKSVVYPGISIDSIYVGEKSRDEVYDLFEKKNQVIRQNSFNLTYDDNTATISARDLNIGYNSKLLADQAFNLGRSSNALSNFYIMINSSINGLSLVTSYTYSKDNLKDKLAPIQKEIFQPAVNAQFAVENNRVVTFVQSQNGKTIDFDKVSEKIEGQIPHMLTSSKSRTFSYNLPIKTLIPAVTTEKANNMGIVEVIGVGRSNFFHSIPNRVHNVSLAASRINGILVPPGETFSFNKAIGDISKFSGFKEAYVIQNGKTVLGDGGGVCQVSTTLFRAVLDAGLPIVERHAHAYRVGYYEQNSDPGLDATIYTPSVDFRFKNDTGHHILIQSFLDPTELSLTFTFYGTNDGREVAVTKPILTSQTPPPEARYQDDPTLPKGTVKQVEYAAWGATVQFSRTVKKNGKILYQDDFSSRYTPWQAVYLNGTKEG